MARGRTQTGQLRSSVPAWASAAGDGSRLRPPHTTRASLEESDFLSSLDLPLRTRSRGSKHVVSLACRLCHLGGPGVGGTRSEPTLASVV